MIKHYELIKPFSVIVPESENVEKDVNNILKPIPSCPESVKKHTENWFNFIKNYNITADVTLDIVKDLIIGPTKNYIQYVIDLDKRRRLTFNELKSFSADMTSIAYQCENIFGWALIRAIFLHQDFASNNQYLVNQIRSGDAAKVILSADYDLSKKSTIPFLPKEKIDELIELDAFLKECAGYLDTLRIPDDMFVGRS